MRRGILVKIFCLRKKDNFDTFRRMRMRRGPIDEGANPEGDLFFRKDSGVERDPQQLMEERRRSRILDGALNVFGEKGFAAATVQDLIEEVGISRATFYKYFPDREACLVALNDAVLAWLENEAREAIGPAVGWPAQVRAVTERLVELVSGDVRVARVCGFEATLVSAEIWARRKRSLDALAEALRSGRAHSRWGDELPAELENFLVGGTTELATRSIVLDRRRRSKDLAPALSELILLPYLGAARARKLVRGG
jgi:AcrR family transcriptional regulator